MQWKGSSITWSHVLSLYYSNTGADKAAPGLCLVTKLKREHVYLTSFSKMRVDLASSVCVFYREHARIIFWMQQVLSQSVANAFRMRGKHVVACLLRCSTTVLTSTLTLPMKGVQEAAG